MQKKSCIILAAGDGKRMKSNKPKALMEVAFQPMLEWVINSVTETGITKDQIAVITGNNAELITQRLNDNEKYKGIKTFLQAERKGTGHAVMQAEPFLKEIAAVDGDVLVLCGDAPFMDKDTISNAYELHTSKKYSSTTITADIDDPSGYGRIVRGANGELSAIVEHKDCDGVQIKITEINSGGHWFNAAKLLEALPKLNTENKNGEYYLTATIDIIGNAGAYKTDNKDVVLGANDRRGLRVVNQIAARNIIEKHLDNGVDIIGESYIMNDVVIGFDTVILPNTVLKGDTVIGNGCVIGPNSVIENCKVGDNVTLNNVQAFASTVEDDVTVGPFTHIRPGSVLRKGVKIGDFVEVKNSDIGEKTSIAHLTYIGDSDVGSGVNFGCGCVTANYDGIDKHRTVIGDDAFIGCNTNLIAPVKIGNNATTAAGTTITRDVPDNSLAIERGTTVVKENWEKNFLRIKK